MRIIMTLALLSIASLSVSPLFAQQETNGVIQEAFLPYETGPGTPYRSASGAPAEAYWQNSADYEMEVQLYPEEHKVTNSMTIHYANNSPLPLEFIWLKLDQNLFERESWGSKLTPYAGSRFGNRGFDGGITIDNLTVQ